MGPPVAEEELLNWEATHQMLGGKSSNGTNFEILWGHLWMYVTGVQTVFVNR
jgi:hypothetical protein